MVTYAHIRTAAIRSVTVMAGVTDGQCGGLGTV
jgi:hypothetical protein